MKIEHSVCIECVKGWGEKPPKVIPLRFAKLKDAGYYEFSCEKSHKYAVVLPNQKFELLFHAACMALLDGYDREAAFNFAASLERFYEFFMRILFKHCGVETNQVDQAWVLLSNQSERQFGAFVLLYTYCFKKAPQLMENKWVKFRNDVIHKGYFPEENEVVGYGTAIWEFIRARMQELVPDYQDSMNQVVSDAMRQINERVPRGAVRSTRGVFTAIDVSFFERVKDVTFGQLLASLKGQGGLLTM